MIDYQPKPINFRDLGKSVLSMVRKGPVFESSKPTISQILEAQTGSKGEIPISDKKFITAAGQAIYDKGGLLKMFQDNGTPVEEQNKIVECLGQSGIQMLVNGDTKAALPALAPVLDFYAETRMIERDIPNPLTTSLLKFNTDKNKLPSLIAKLYKVVNQVYHEGPQASFIFTRFMQYDHPSSSILVSSFATDLLFEAFKAQGDLATKGEDIVNAFSSPELHTNYEGTNFTETDWDMGVAHLIGRKLPIFQKSEEYKASKPSFDERFLKHLPYFIEIAFKQGLEVMQNNAVRFSFDELEGVLTYLHAAELDKNGEITASIKKTLNKHISDPQLRSKIYLHKKEEERRGDKYGFYTNHPHMISLIQDWGNNKSS